MYMYDDACRNAVHVSLTLEPFGKCIASHFRMFDSRVRTAGIIDGGPQIPLAFAALSTPIAECGR